MTFDHLHAPFAGVSPVAVHDEGNVVRDGARFEDTEEDMSDALYGTVTEPEGVLQKRHNGGCPRQVIGFRGWKLLLLRSRVRSRVADVEVLVPCFQWRWWHQD